MPRNGSTIVAGWVFRKICRHNQRSVEFRVSNNISLHIHGFYNLKCIKNTLKIWDWCWFLSCTLFDCCTDWLIVSPFWISFSKLGATQQSLIQPDLTISYLQYVTHSLRIRPPYVHMKGMIKFFKKSFRKICLHPWLFSKELSMIVTHNARLFIFHETKDYFHEHDLKGMGSQPRAKGGLSWLTKEAVEEPLNIAD